MALTFTERGIVPLSEGKMLVAFEITGDGSTTNVSAVSLKLQRVSFSFLANIDEATFTPLSTNTGTTLTKADAFESTKKVLLVAVGY